MNLPVIKSYTRPWRPETRLCGALLLLVAFGVTACGCPQTTPTTSPAATSAAPPVAPVDATTPDPGLADTEPRKTAPHRAPGLDKAARDAIKKEYHSLALNNDCSGALDIRGTWRFIGESRTPEYTDVLTVTGSKFTEVLGGKPDGRRVDATVAGEIRCLFKNRVLVQLDSVSPEGAFGNKTGDSYPCDMLGDMSGRGERMLMICYFDWDVRTAAGLEFEYERVDVK